MSVVRWAAENYDAGSVYRRTLVTGIVTFAEWSLSALLALVPLMGLYLAFEWAGIEVGVQTLTFLWVGLTALVLHRVRGWAGRPDRTG